MKVLISGGLGDSVNQLAKLIYYCKKENITHDSILVTYCSDIHDQQITETNLKNNLVAIRDMVYKDFIKDLTIVNDFKFKSILADQRKEAESNNYDMVFGSNMNYEVKVWEEARQLHVGHRPNELQIVPNSIIDWKYKTVPDVDIAVHVRFAEENPTKELCSFVGEGQLLRLLKELNYKVNKIHLFGRTKHDLSKFSKIVSMHLDKPFLDQYNTILSAKKFVIGFEGFSSLLPLSAGIKTYRKLRDPLEKTLTVNPEWDKKYCVDYNNFEEIKDD
jgi:hypothetical protein|tara:strand:- start:122 stop:946 length:825 start_codon:yes stop_codon:yes gene_type:complete